MWGAAAAIGFGALVLVVLVNKQREAQTQAMIAAAQSNVYKPGGALSFTDAFNAGATAVITYVGGAGAGAQYAKGIQ